MDWSRRSMLGAAALMGGGLARAQRPPPVAAPLLDNPLEPLALAMLANQVTRMSIEVMVEGTGPHTFVIDTGAGRTTIAADLAERLNLRAGPKVLVHGVVAAQVTASVEADSLSVVGARFRDLTMPVAPRARLGADGLLGLDVLGGFRLMFDTRGGEVRLSRSGGRGVLTGGPGFSTGSRLRNENALRTRQRRGRMTMVGVSADGVGVEAFIDSGAQYSVGNLALWRSLGARRPSIRDRRYQVPLVGVNGQRLMGDLALLETLRIGVATIRDVPTVFADLHAFEVLGLKDQPALLLGADLIGAFNRVTLDFARGEVRFAGLRRRPATVLDARPG